MVVYKLDNQSADDTRSVLSVNKVTALTPAETLQRKLQAQSFLRLAQNVPSPKPFQVQVLCYVIKV